ncbi:MAG TPA: hypothetical protein VF329_02440 [Gammaproteobacteria bacterium]
MEWVRMMGVPCLGMLVWCGSALAQEVDPELTMTLIKDPDDLPSVVTHTLELPDPAAEEGVLHSADGLATANARRAEAAARREEALRRAEENRGRGLDRAAAAQERGAELAAEIAETARENRESVVRGAADRGLVLPTDSRPGVPPVERPELPERPAAVTGGSGG